MRSHLASSTTPSNISRFVPGSSITKTSVANIVDSAKRSHPFKLIFVRFGDFYELAGVDAVVMQAITGLAAQGSDSRPFVGFPKSKIQEEIDTALSHGFLVCVYEELPQGYDQRAKKEKKQRALMKVLSPEDPVYDPATLSSDGSLARWEQETESPTPAVLESGTSDNDFACALYLFYRSSRKVHVCHGLTSDQATDIMAQRCPCGSILYVHEKSVHDRSDSATLPLKQLKHDFFEVKAIPGDAEHFYRKVEADLAQFFELDLASWPFTVIDTTAGAMSACTHLLQRFLVSISPS